MLMPHTHITKNHLKKEKGKEKAGGKYVAYLWMFTVLFVH